MKLIICCLVFGFLVGAVHAQSRFELDNRSLIILDDFQPAQQIRSVDQTESTDEQVNLFRGYFNPPSFEAYKQYFLSRDWSGMTEEDFQKWQDYIKSNSLRLERIYQVRVDDAKEFLVFQVVFESPEFIIPNSLILKKTGAGWKHISLMNDPEADILKKFGELQHSVIHQRSQGNTSISLHTVPQSELRHAFPKFDREVLFNKVATLLERKSVAAADIRIAKTMFLNQDEHGMASFLAGLQKTDLHTWMKEINEAVGFSLFTILRTRDTQ